MTDAPNCYSPPLVALHWLTLLLLAAGYALMEFKGIFPKGSVEREAMKSWQFTLGMTVFVLTVLRLLLRLVSTRPPIVPAPAHWQELSGKLLHGLLYLLLAMPIAGWLVVSGLSGHGSFWGIELPALMGPDKAPARDIKEVHETVAGIGYALIGLHAVAALHHYYAMRDNTLLHTLGLKPHAVR